MTSRTHPLYTLTTALPWHARLRDVPRKTWRALTLALPDSGDPARDRYLAGACSHADLERRIRCWDNAARGPWW